MKKKILAGLTAIALGLGLAVASALPAQAHTSGGTWSGECVDGNYDVTFTVFADNAPANSTVTVTAISPSSLGSQSGPGNKDVKFTATFPGNTVQPSASFRVEWSDGYVVSPVVITALSLTGNCVVVPPDTPDTDTITYCHATASSTNPYNKITTSKAAFYQAGHVGHGGDIYPAGSIVKQGQTFSWSAQGDQSLLQYPDCQPPKVYPPVVTPGAPVPTAPTCDVDGFYAFPVGAPAAENDGKPIASPAPGAQSVQRGVTLDGYHLYVRNLTGQFGAPGDYKWDAYGIGANGNAAYPIGTSVGGKVDGQGNPKAGGTVSGTFTVLPATGFQTSDPNAPCYNRPGVPDPKVTYTDWVDGEFECDDTEYEQTRVVTTTPQVWNEATKSYVDDVANVTTVIETRTVERVADCPVEEPPTEEPPVEQPPVDEELPPTEALADTGDTTDNMPLLVSAWLFVTLGLSLIAAGFVRRRQTA